MKKPVNECTFEDLYRTVEEIEKTIGELKAAAEDSQEQKPGGFLRRRR